MNHYQIAVEEMNFYGVENTSLQNFLAIQIGSEIESSITGQLSGLGIKNLMGMTKEDFMEYKGIGEIEATRLFSAFGLVKYSQAHDMRENYKIGSPKDAAYLFRDLEYHEQEVFEVLFLNTKGIVIGRKQIFKGSISMTAVHPREIFKEALKANAVAIICGHNHPSGFCDPSESDIEFTKVLVEGGNIVGIEVVDHLIIGRQSFISLKEKGYFEN